MTATTTNPAFFLHPSGVIASVILIPASLSHSHQCQHAELATAALSYVKQAFVVITCVRKLSLIPAINQITPQSIYCATVCTLVHVCIIRRQCH